MELDESVNGFSGRLENFPLLDVIQMACIARRDGRLDIRHKAEMGKVFLERGQIVCVETGRSVGEDALLEILCWETGTRSGRHILEPPLLWIVFEVYRLRPTFRRSSSIGLTHMPIQNGRDVACRLRRNGKSQLEEKRVCVIPGATGLSMGQQIFWGVVVRFRVGPPWVVGRLTVVRTVYLTWVGMFLNG